LSTILLTASLLVTETIGNCATELAKASSLKTRWLRFDTGWSLVNKWRILMQSNACVRADKARARNYCQAEYESAISC